MSFHGNRFCIFGNFLKVIWICWIQKWMLVFFSTLMGKSNGHYTHVCEYVHTSDSYNVSLIICYWFIFRCSYHRQSRIFHLSHDNLAITLIWNMWAFHIWINALNFSRCFVKKFPYLLKNFGTQNFKFERCEAYDNKK